MTKAAGPGNHSPVVTASIRLVRGRSRGSVEDLLLDFRVGEDEELPAIDLREKTTVWRKGRNQLFIGYGDRTRYMRLGERTGSTTRLVEPLPATMVKRFQVGLGKADAHCTL